MKVFNLRDPSHKTDIGNSCGRTVFHLLKKSVGNQYLKVLIILVPPEILNPLEISAQFERHYLWSTEYFPDLIHKKDFDIYDPVTICNLPTKLPPNKYMSRIFRILVPSQILHGPCIFWTDLELLLDQNCLIFKMPYKKLILTFIRSKDSVLLYQKM